MGGFSPLLVLLLVAAALRARAGFVSAAGANGLNTTLAVAGGDGPVLIRGGAAVDEAGPLSGSGWLALELLAGPGGAAGTFSAHAEAEGRANATAWVSPADGAVDGPGGAASALNLSYECHGGGGEAAVRLAGAVAWADAAGEAPLAFEVEIRLACPEECADGWNASTTCWARGGIENVHSPGENMCAGDVARIWWNVTRPGHLALSDHGFAGWSGHAGWSLDVAAPGAGYEDMHVPFMVTDGVWYLTGARADDYAAVAVLGADAVGGMEVARLTEITTLDVTDPQCVARHAPADVALCSGGRGTYNAAAGVCACEAGFFGYACEMGCAPLATTAAFGGRFDSDVSGGGQYSPLADCSWALAPVTAHGDPAAEVVVTLERVHLGDGDTVRVYAGASAANESALVQEVSGLQLGAVEVRVPAPTALVRFTADGHRSAPLLPGHLGGFGATFLGVGCPAGSAAVAADDPAAAAAGDLECRPCAAGTYSAEADAPDGCQPCPAGTHAPRAGASACLSCPAEFFQDEEGAAECKVCARYAYRDGACPTPPTASYSVRWAISTFVASSGALTVACAAATLYYRNEPAVRSAAVPFMLALCGGVALVLVGSLLYVLEPRSDAWCTSRLWCLALGANTSLGALVLKSWRLHRIFHTRRLRAAAVSNRRLGLLLGALVGASALVLAVATAAHPLVLRSPTYPRCESLPVAVAVVLAVPVAALVACGLALSYLTRDLPSLFGESAGNAAALYNVALTSAVMAAFALFTNTDEQTTTAAISGFVAYIAAFSLLVLFAPMLLRASRSRADKRRKQQFKRCERKVTSLARGKLHDSASLVGDGGGRGSSGGTGESAVDSAGSGAAAGESTVEAVACRVMQAIRDAHMRLDENARERTILQRRLRREQRALQAVLLRPDTNARIMPLHSVIRQHSTTASMRTSGGSAADAAVAARRRAATSLKAGGGLVSPASRAKRTGRVSALDTSAASLPAAAAVSDSQPQSPVSSLAAASVSGSWRVGE